MKTKLKTTLALLTAFLGLQLFTAIPAMAADAVLAQWNGDLAASSKKGTWTMTAGTGCTFSSGNATITGSSSTANTGLIITPDTGSFTGNDMTVVVKYSGLQDSSTGTQCYMTVTPSSSGELAVGRIPSGSPNKAFAANGAGGSYQEKINWSNFPQQGLMMASFTSSSGNKGIRLYFAEKNSDGTYKPFRLAAYKSCLNSSETYSAIRIGGSTSAIKTYHRPSMVVEGVTIKTGNSLEIGLWDPMASYTKSGYVKNSASQLFMSNTQLSSISNAMFTAYANGSSISYKDSAAAAFFPAYTLTGDNLTTIQTRFCIPDNGYVKSVLVSFTQSGNDIYYKADSAGYVSDRTTELTASTSWTDSTVAESAGSTAYGMHDLTINKPYDKTASASGTTALSTLGLTGTTEANASLINVTAASTVTMDAATTAFAFKVASTDAKLTLKYAAANTLTAKTVDFSTAAGKVAFDTTGLAAPATLVSGTIVGADNIDIAGSTLDPNTELIVGAGEIKIVPTITGAAKIGDTGYETVALAFAAVQDGQTVTLLQACTETLTAPAKSFTLALNGFAMSGSLATVDNSNITLNYGGGSFTSSVTGGGTIVMPNNTLPTDAFKTSLVNAAWTGTVWIKNISWLNWDFENYGNANSKVKVTGVTGYGAKKNYAFNGTLILADDGTTAALDSNDGYGGYCYTIAKLEGSGTFKASRVSTNAKYRFVDVSGFTGTITTASNRKVFIGSGSTDSDNGCILVESGATATIASGKTWTAAGPMVVNGTLNNNGTISGTIKGSGTIVYRAASTGTGVNFGNPSTVLGNQFTGTMQVSQGRYEVSGGFGTFSGKVTNGGQFYLKNGFDLGTTGLTASGNGWTGDSSHPGSYQCAIRFDGGATVTGNLTLVNEGDYDYVNVGVIGSATFNGTLLGSTKMKLKGNNNNGTLDMSGATFSGTNPIEILTGSTLKLGGKRIENVVSGAGTVTAVLTAEEVAQVEGGTSVRLFKVSGSAPTTVTVTDSSSTAYETQVVDGYCVVPGAILRTHLTWNGTAWVTEGGDPVTTIDSTYILDAKNGDNITFGSAATPFAFNMPTANGDTVTITDQNNLTVSAIEIPANVTLAIGANANPGFNVTGTGIFKYAASAADGTPVPAAKLANFNGTFWMAKGRHRYSGVAIAQTVTLKITDGATLMPEGSATTVWSNPMIVSGQGWGSSGVESCAIRMHENAQLGPNCTVTFEKVNGKNPTIGTTGTSLINASLTGTDGFEKRGGGTLTLGTPKTQAANLSGEILVSGGTLKVGNGGNSGCSAGNEVQLGNATITVNSGATVDVHCWTTAAQSALTTDKVKIMTPITVNGGTFNIHDGGHAFMGAVTINGTVGGTFKYHKGWLFNDLRIPAGSTFNPTCEADGTYNAYFSVLGGNVAGTLNVTNGGGDNKEMRFCVSGNALANGTLNIQNNGGTGAYIYLVGDATLGQVTGNALAAFGDGTSRTLTLNGGTYDINFKDVGSGKSDAAKLNLVIAGNVTLNGNNTANVCSGTLVVNAGATLTAGNLSVLPAGEVTVSADATLNVAGQRGVKCASIAGAGTVKFEFTQAEVDAGSTPVVILAKATETALTVPANVTFSDGSNTYTASVNADGALTVRPDEHLVTGDIHATLTADTPWNDIVWYKGETPIGTGKDLSRTTTATLTANGNYTVTLANDVTMNNVTIGSGTGTISFSGQGRLYATTVVVNGRVGGSALVAESMTIDAAAEIDTRNGSPTCTGTVTYPSTTKVRVSAMPTAGSQVTVLATPGTIGAAVPTMAFYVGDATEPTALPAGTLLVWGYNGLFLRDVASDNPAYAAVDDPATHSRNWIWFDADCGTNLDSGDWENRGLPIGNGRIGAVVMENRDKVRLALNEISFWSGGTNKNASAYEYGPYANKDKFGSYQPFGDFMMEQPTLAGGTVKRALDLTSGIAQGEIVKDGITYTRRTYASRPDQVVVTTLEANKKGAITGKFTLMPDHTAVAESSVDANGKGVLKYSGTLANGMKFAATAYVIADGGTLAPTRTGEEAIAVTYTGDGNAQMPSRTVNSAICVDGATKVTVVIAMNTDYICSDAENWVRKDDTPDHISATNALQAAGIAEATMRTSSIEAHQNYFNTCDVTLGATDAAQSALPTPTRLANYKTGTKDAELEATLFQMGRYLLIGSSGDAIPANLQGLWNDKVHAPWASDYHTNINIQENYWSAEVTGLSDLHLSLFNWLHEAMPTMRRDTAANFKCYTNAAASVRGWTARVSQNPFGAGGWTQWNTPINAWYALHYWEHYQFTMDEDFLRDTAYPVLKEASQFWCDYLKPLCKNDQGVVTNFLSSVSLTDAQRAQLNAMDEGTLVSPNGWSHEHGPNEDGVTFDQQLVRNLFNNTIAAATKLNVDAAFVAELTDKRSHLATNQIGKGSATVAGGYLQEWLVDRPDMVDTSHRHTSHLMAVFPCNEINIYDTPELLAAAANSLARRGEVSDSRRSWTWPWRGALWARMHNAAKAHDQVEGLLKHNTLNNLWTTHTPYQIDGNLSYPAAVAEMLVQSQVAGQIELLPGADTTEWPSGSVTGIRARGAITVDFTWSDGKVTGYELHADAETPVRLMYDGIAEDVVAPCAKTILPRVTVPSVGWKGDFAAGARRGFTMDATGVTLANGTATIDTGFLTVTPPAGNARYSAAVFTAKAPAGGLGDGQVLYGMDVTASSGLEPGQENGLMGIVSKLVDSDGHVWAMWLGAPASSDPTRTPNLQPDLGAMGAAMRGYGDAIGLVEPASRFSVDGTAAGNGTGLKHTYVVNATAYTFGGLTGSASKTAAGAEFGSIFIFRNEQLTQDELNLWTAPAVTTFQLQKHVELSGSVPLTGSTRVLSVATTAETTLAVADGVSLETYGGLFANHALTIDLRGWTAPGAVISGPIYSTDRITVQVNDGDEYSLTADGLILTKVGEQVTYSATVPSGTAVNWQDISWQPAGERPADADYTLVSGGNATLVLPEGGATVGSLTLSGEFVVKMADAAFTDGCWVKTLLTFAPNALSADDCVFAPLPSGFEGKYVVTDTAILLYAQNKEVISVNIAGGRGTGTVTDATCLVAGTDYFGLAPVPGNSWMNVTKQWQSGAAFAEKSTTIDNITGYIGTKAYAHIRASGVCGANNTYTDGLSSSPIIHGYLDDGGYGTGTNAWLSITGIPYSEYDVIVYASTDSSSSGFRPVKVNGKTYTAGEGGVAVEGTDNWGTVRQTAVQFATNAMIVKGLTDADLTVFGGNNASSGRGGIAAIQIVCTGYVTEAFDFTADITSTPANWDNGVGEGLANQNIGWVNSPEATITLTNLTPNATLTLDTDILAKSFKVVSAAGCGLTVVTNGTAQLDIAAYDFSEAAGGVTYDMAATAPITVGANTVFTQKANPVADIIIPNGVHYAVDGLTVTRARGEGVFTKSGSGEATLTYGYKATANGVGEPFGIEVTGGKLTLGHTRFFASNGNWYNNVGIPLTVTGGTLDLNHVYTFAQTANEQAGTDLSGWLTQKTITLGSGAVITNGNVTFYSTMSGVDAVRYLGGNGENQPATFAANWHGSYSNGEYHRTINVEKGAGAEYDLLFSGDIGIAGGTNPGLFATSVVHKVGLGTIKVTGSRNYPGLSVEAGTWIVAGPVNDTHAPNAFINVAAGATIDYATPATVVLLPRLTGAGTVKHSATGLDARLKFGDTSGFTGTIEIPADAVIATPTPIRDNDTTFTVTGAGRLYLMLTQAQRGYIEPYMLNMKAASGFAANQIVVCDEMGNPVPDHVARIDDQGNVWFDPAGDQILFWDNDNARWTDKDGEVVAESAITSTTILSMADGDEVSFASDVTPLALSLPAAGTVTVTNGFTHLGLASIAVSPGVTLKVTFPALAEGDITPYAITNHFGGGGTLELALADDCKYATSLPVSAANFPSGYEMTLKVSAGQFKATSVLPSNVTIESVAGAQFFISGGTWDNTFVLSGNGYHQSSSPSAWDCTALRFDNATLSGNATIRLVDDGTTHVPAIGNYYASTCNARFDGVGVRIRSDLSSAQLTFATPANFGGYESPVVIENGSIRYGDSATAADVDYGFGSSVTINSGATVEVWLQQNSTRRLVTPVTMNGGTLKSKDGRYTFSSVTIAAASTISMAYGKTFTFNELHGSANLTLTQFNSDSQQGTFAIVAGDYSGTMAVSAARETDFVPTGAALDEATVNVGANIKLVTDTTTVVKMVKMLNNTCLKNNSATVNAGTTLDLNGTHGTANSITLNGGKLVNNGTGTGNSQIQTPTITLTADSEIGGSGNFYMIASSYNATTLTLNGHTLRKTGGNTFYLCNTTVGVDNETGILSIDEGTLSLHNKDSNIKGTVTLNGGTLSVPSGRTLTLKGLIRNDGTITNSGTITGVAVLGGVIYPDTIGGTVAFANHVTIPVGAVKTSAAMATALDGKLVTAEANTIFMFGDAANRTAVIDAASVGNIGVVLTAEEYASYQGTGDFQIDIPCNATAAGAFGGQFYFVAPDEKTVLFASKSIVAKDAAFVIRATRPAATRTPPFTATVTSNCTWTAAGWVDAENIPVQAADWASASAVNATMTVAQGADYTVTLDTQVSLGTFTVVNAGTLRIVKPTEYGITIGAVNDAGSAGTTYLPPTDVACDVTAGANTVMETANKGGTLTVADGKKATVVYPWTGTLALGAGGYLKYTGECATALDLSDFSYANATVELAGTFTLKGKFGENVDGGKLIASGNITMQNDETRLVHDANDRFELADGTVTLTARIGAPRWASTRYGTIDITGGTLTATESGFFYPGAACNNGTLTNNISGGTFNAPFNPYRNTWDYRNVVNVSGTGVFAPANLWTSSDGNKPTVDDTETHRNAQTTVNLTGGAFNVPKGVPDWVVVNVNGDATLGIQAGVPRAAVRSAVTVAEGATLTVDVPAGQTNEFTQAILGTGNIVKTGDGVLMFKGAMPNVGLEISGGIVGFKLPEADIAAYKGGVLELYRSDVLPPDNALYVASATDYTAMLPVKTTTIKNGKVVVSKYTFPIKPTTAGAITTTGATWIDSSATPVPYVDGFDHKVASILITGAVTAWTNDVASLDVGTLELTDLENALDLANAAGKAMAFDEINATYNEYPIHFRFDTLAAAITANYSYYHYYYGSGSGDMALTESEAYFVSYDDGADQTYSGVISGAGAVTKEGTGKTTLSGANAYTGGTTISAGTLAAGTGSSFGTGAVTVSTGATVEIEAGQPLAAASVTVAQSALVSVANAAAGAEQFKITAGTLTLPMEEGKNIAPYLLVNGTYADGKWVQAGNWVSKSTGSTTIHDVLWENVNGKATDVDNISLASLTLNFSDSSGMNSAIIGGEGRVKITKIRFAQRNNTTSDITALKLTQDGVTVEATVTKEGTIDIVKTDSSVVSRPAFVCTFDSDVTFKTYRPITLTFNNNSAAGMAVIKPANSTFGYNGYTPVIEVTGDYTTWQARTISVNFGVYNTAYTQVSGEYGVVPSGKWRNVDGPDNRNGTTVYASDDTASATLYWYSDRGETVTTDNSYDNLMRNTLEGNGTGWIRLTGIPFNGYDVVVYQQNVPKGTAAGQTFQFNPPAINGIYYSYDGSQVSLVPNDPALRYGRTNLKTPVEGANGNVVYVKDAFSGDLYIKAAGNPTDGGLYGGIAAIQIVERTDVDVHYAAIPANAASPYGFDDLVWTPAEPSEGFSTVSILNVTNLAADATLAFDRAVSAARINFVGAGDLSIAAIDDESVRPNIVKWDSSQVAGTMTHLGDVRSRVEFWLGPDTVFAGTFTGKIVSAPEGGHVHYAKSGIALAADAIASYATNYIDKGSITGDFSARSDEEMNLQVEDGNVVSLSPTDAYRTSALNLHVFGGELTFTPTDKLWMLANRAYEQTGGLVTFAAEGAGTAAASSVIPNCNASGMATMNISGGTTDVSRTTFWLDGPTTVNVSGTGVLKVKKIHVGNADRAHNVNLTGGGTLEIGAGGIPAGLDALNLDGGKIFATDDARIAQTVTATAGSKLGAADGKILVVEGNAGTLANATVENEGTGKVVFFCDQGETRTDLPAGACLGYKEQSIDDAGEITVPYTALPVSLFRRDGITPIADYTAVTTGVETITFSFEPQFDGEACHWDYEFVRDTAHGKTGNENTGTDKTALTWNSGSPADAHFVQQKDGSRKGVYLTTMPYRGASYADSQTFAFYGTLPASNNTYIVSFGKSNTSEDILFFATGDAATRKVQLVHYNHNSGEDPAVLCTLTVPHNATQKHLYGVTLELNELGNTVVTVYLDGEKWQPYVMDRKLNLGPGFQIARPFGGEYGKLAAADFEFIKSGDTAEFDWLRVYDGVLSASVFEQMAAKYPFENPQGKWIRDTATAGTGTYGWQADGGWYASTNTAVKIALPEKGSDTEIRTSGATTVEVNTAEDQGITSLKIVGDGTVTFDRASENEHKVHVSGSTVIGTDVVTKNFALDLNGGHVTVKAGKTLTFDMSAHDIGQYTSNTELCLAGYTVLEPGAAIDYVKPTQETSGTVFGRATSLFQSEATGHYHMMVVVRLENALGAGTAARNGWDYMTASATAGSCWEPGAAKAPDIWASGTPDWAMISERFTATNGNATVTFDKNAALGILEVAGTDDVTLTTNENVTVSVDHNKGWYDFREAEGKVTVLFPTGSTKIYLGPETELLGGEGSSGTLFVEAGKTARVRLHHAWSGMMEVGEGGQIILETAETQEVRALDVKPGSTLTVVTNTTQDAAIKVTSENATVDLAGVNIELAVSEDPSVTYDPAGGTYNLINAKSIVNDDLANIESITNRGVWTVGVVTEGGRDILRMTKAPAFYVKPTDGVVADQGNKVDSLDIPRSKIPGSPATAAEAVTALNAEGQNGMKVWESIVLGYESTEPTSRMTVYPKQGNDPTSVQLFSPPMPTVDESTGADVTYGYESKDGSGDWATVSGLGDVDPYTPRTLTLPSSGVRYFRLKANISVKPVE